MGNTVDRDSPERALAQAFAARIARWAHARGAPDAASEAARAAAHAVSMAVSSGHTCVPLADVAAGSDVLELRAQLTASRVVGGTTEFPLVVDAADRLYLARYFDYESRLAREIVRRARAPRRVVAPAAAAMLDAQFGSNSAAAQKIAVALALLRSLTIVSGGPGTGKTTTIVKVIACLIAEAPESRIALAAPTGKAAARLQEALASFRPSLPPAIADRLPADVYTVHRLLGVRGDDRAFRHDALHPLPFDVVVVDEASMLDLALATHLAEAVPQEARLLLVGDKDQLSAVEAGAVFAELSSGVRFMPDCRDALAAATRIPAETIATMARAAPGALPDAVIWLTDNFRFAPDSGIGRVAAAVNQGDVAATFASLRDDAAASVRWIDDGDPTPASATLASIADGYAEFVAALRAAPLDRSRAFAAFARFRVLCAERRGPRGADGINATMTARVREATDSAAAPAIDAGDDGWFVGRAVMVRENDYFQRLFNGDVGLALPDDAGALRIWFVAPEGGFRAIAPARLPAHDTAFATTVHKAQGSEFDDVVLLLPAHASRVVTRELVYTAITRARRCVVIAADAATLEAAIATPTRRDSGLTDRIADALSSSSSPLPLASVAPAQLFSASARPAP